MDVPYAARRGSAAKRTRRLELPDELRYLCTEIASTYAMNRLREMAADLGVDPARTAGKHDLCMALAAHLQLAQTELAREDVLVELVPDEYLDPVTRDLLVDPVVASNGVSYNPITLARQRFVDPNTGRPFEHDLYYSNRTLSDAVARWLREHGDQRLAQVLAVGIAFRPSARTAAQIQASVGASDQQMLAQIQTVRTDSALHRYPDPRPFLRVVGEHGKTLVYRSLPQGASAAERNVLLDVEPVTGQRFARLETHTDDPKEIVAQLRNIMPVIVETQVVSAPVSTIFPLATLREFLTRIRGPDRHPVGLRMEGVAKEGGYAGHPVRASYFVNPEMGDVLVEQKLVPDGPVRRAVGRSPLALRVDPKDDAAVMRLYSQLRNSFSDLLDVGLFPSTEFGVERLQIPGAVAAVGRFPPPAPPPQSVVVRPRPVIALESTGGAVARPSGARLLRPEQEEYGSPLFGGGMTAEEEEMFAEIQRVLAEEDPVVRR